MGKRKKGFVEQQEPHERRYSVSCGNGLHLDVRPTGGKSWTSRYRWAGKAENLVHGDAHGIPISTARRLNSEVQEAVALGKDPAAERRAGRMAAVAAQANTLQATFEAYLALHRKRGQLRTLGQREATMRRLIFPKLGQRPIGEVSREEIEKFLDGVEKRGARMADVTRATMNVVFNWAATRSNTFRNPLVKTPKRDQKPARDRILTDDELRSIWSACDKVCRPFGAFVRFALLVGARKSEIAGLVRSELVNGDWEIPAARSKNKMPHLIPLSDAAKAITAGMPVILGSPYVFTASGQKGLTNWSTYKAAIDKASGVTGWTVHDLRRTARSLMSRAGVSADHAEIAIGHKLTGIRGTYDRHAYHAEKKHAFEALARQIDMILNPPADNVEVLRRA